MRFGAENPETSSGKIFLEPRQSAWIQDQLVQLTIILDCNAGASKRVSQQMALRCFEWVTFQPELPRFIALRYA